MVEIYGRIFLRIFERVFWGEFFDYIEIDLFVKTFVFVKILCQGRRKKEGSRRNF